MMRELGFNLLFPYRLPLRQYDFTKALGKVHFKPIRHSLKL